MQLRDFPGTLRAKFCSDERSEVTVAYQSLSARSEPLRLKVSVEQSPRSSVLRLAMLWWDTVTLWYSGSVTSISLMCNISLSLSTLWTVWVYRLASTELRLMLVCRQGNPPLPTTPLQPPARDSTTQGWTLSGQPGIQAGYSERWQYFYANY